MAMKKNKEAFAKLKKVKARIIECRKSQKLILSGLELSDLPQGFMNLLKAGGVNVINELDFHNNLMTNLIPELGDFRHVKFLRLNQNNFNELPSVVFAFHKLQVLDVSDNNLKDMNSSLYGLTNLRELNFSGNNLASLFEGWRVFGSLLYLNVAHNKLANLPESIGSLRSLQRLNASKNFLTSLPSSLQNLAELVSLDLHGNQLTSIIPTLCMLKRLQEVNCDGNPLSEPAKTMYAKGFEDFIEYLREVDLQQKLEELIRQKPPGSVVGKYKKFPTRFDTGPGGPCFRTGHSMTQAGAVIYMFGGHVSHFGKVDELYSFDVRTLLWVKPVTSGTPPCHRDGHVSAFDGNKRLYVFGGRNEESKLLNDIYFLDLKSMAWTQPTVDGMIPSPREGASMAFIANQVVLFGGRGNRQRHNDLYTLSPETWIWMPQRTKGSVPAPREYAAVAVAGTNLYVHGGKGNVLLEDLHVLDVEGLVWSRVTHKGLSPLPRYGHIATTQQSTFYVVGGTDGGSGNMGSLFSLSVGDESDSLLNPQISSSSLEDKRGASQSRFNMWVELDPEIVPSPVTMFHFYEGRLIVFQSEDSPADNAGSEDWAGNLWDCYMEAELESLKPSVFQEEREKLLENKTSRVLRTKVEQLPRTYRTISAKEKQLLEHVNHYQERFLQIYPERRPLMLAAQNECGVEKFLCTIIRPSHTEYTELRSWQGCSQFLSNLLTYEELEDPVHFPSYLPSPQSVLQWQRADCFDFSIALASLLAGSTYEAFCVVGYAPLSVTSNDQGQCKCPKSNDDEKTIDTQAVALMEDTRKYSIGSGQILNPSYLSKQRQQRESECRDFVKRFRQTYDQELQLGQSEENDILFNYCAAKTDPEEYKESVKATVNQVVANIIDMLAVNEDLTSEGNEYLEASDSKDSLDGKRIHCWVMVASGKRGLTESFFVEPSTGCQYSLTESPYQAVEYIWNQNNLWINMQSNPRRSGLSDMSWDLNDITKWERVLNDVSRDGFLQETSSLTYERAITTPSEPSDVFVDGATVKPASRSDSRGKVKKTPDDGKGEIQHHWILPESWVPKLHISVDAFVTRCPKGVKRTTYEKCTHEMYAFYGDYVRWDGLIERLCYYDDDNCSELSECHDYFQRRRDHLKKRIFYPKENKTYDIFNAGAAYAIREIEIIEGVKRKFCFHASSRNDGLVSREEVMGKTLEEVFSNPEDSLIYRCAVYGTPESKPQEPTPGSELASETQTSEGETPVKASRASTVRSNRSTSRARISDARKKSARQSRLRSNSARSRTSTPAEDKGGSGKSFNLSITPRKKLVAETFLPIAKLTLKFSKQPSATPQKNVARQVFKILRDQIRVDYHNVDRRLTSVSRVYNKDGSMQVLQIDPFQTELETFQRMDEFHQLLMTERESIKAIRDAENETHDILQQRLKDEQNVILDLPYADVARFKRDELLSQEDEGESKVGGDYLSSFLPLGIKPRQKMTRQQMIEVRQNCLKALRDRLLNRAHIIQARYDEETSILAKRRATFERDREQMTVDEVEKYEQACETSVFRIRILEQRAKEHEQHALEKFTNLDNKLRNDPRLASLFESPLPNP